MSSNFSGRQFDYSLRSDYVMLKDISVAFLGLLITSNFLCYKSEARDRLAYQSTSSQSINTMSQSSAQAMIKQLNDAIRDDPKNPAYFYRRANLYHQLGDKQHALSDYSEAIRKEPMNSQFYLARARLYAEHGDTVLSQADEKQAHFVDPRLTTSGLRPVRARGRLANRPRRNRGLRAVIGVVNQAGNRN
jgi:tetratricopeptide (TPR) repeat protein